MITRLFRSRKRLDSTDPGDRLAAIDALTEEEARAAAATLADLAKSDPDVPVRHAALSRLDDPALLTSLLGHSDMGDAAALRVAELVNQGKATTLGDHPTVLLARLSEAPTTELLDALAEQADEQLLVKAVLAVSREHKARLLALPQFRKASALQALEHRSRDRDKATNRQARERLELIRSQRAEVAALLAQIRDRLASLEKPVTDTSTTEAKKREFLSAAVAKDLAAAQALDQALSAAGEPTTELAALRERFATVPVVPAIEPAVSTAADSSAGTGAGAPQVPVAATPAPAGATAPPVSGRSFDELVAAFEALNDSLAHPIPFERLAEERQALTEEWLKRADHEAPSAAQHQAFERVSHRFRELADANERLAGARLPVLDHAVVPDRIGAETPAEVWQAVDRLDKAIERARRTMDQLRWPDWAARPDALSRLSEAMEQSASRLEHWQGEVEQTLVRIGGHLQSLEKHIDSGELKEARSLAGEVRKALKPIPGRLTREFSRALGRAQARLGELSDWQTFATSPKREALLAAMTALAEQPIAAQDQAERIKSLRAEWNELGPPGRAHDHRLMEQFNAVAERAFEPCRVYFAEQAEVREKNLEARKDICESLASYLTATDWQQTDYKAAEQIMRVARQEWQRFHPVDRNPGKPVEARFEALQQELHDRIKAEWDRNLAEKRAIVAEAQALAASNEEHRQKTEAAKTLQHRWRAVGVTPRRPDQVLWRDFRAACDLIFAARDDAVKQAHAQVQASQTEAEALIANFQARLDSAAASLAASDLRDFQTAFDALPPLPERLRRPVERAYDQLVRAAQQELRNRRLAEERQRLINLKSLDEQVTELEIRQQAGESIAFEAPDPIFAGRCAGDDATVPSEALTRLVIEAEIAAGLESIEGDLRMAIQVELMNTGRGREVLEADPEALTERWCQVGPKDASIAALRERFFRAIGKLSTS